MASITELKAMKNPPKMIGTVMTQFANFYKLDNSNEHTWATVLKQLSKPQAFIKALQSMDFDSVSGPSVKRIKNM